MSSGEVFVMRTTKDQVSFGIFKARSLMFKGSLRRSYVYPRTLNPSVTVIDAKTYPGYFGNKRNIMLDEINRYKTDRI